MTSASTSDFLLASEAARLLGVSRQSVCRWAGQGRLRATRTSGGVRLFARREVEQLRDSLRRDTETEAQAAPPLTEPAG
jgi:excisionase family DNA binding protein